MTNQQARVLVVEDDDPIRSALDVSLRGEGYEVRAEPDGTHLQEVADGFRPDLAVLDVRLPVGPDGYAMARALRASSDMPILFLTAADGIDDRLAGFDAGADDYLVKPFSMAELLARVQALLRRAGRLVSAVRQVGDVVIDEGGRTAMRSGHKLDLTRTEYELLAMLAQHPGQVLSKVQLLTQVWGFDAYDANLVEVHMVALRRKLEAYGPRVVHTVRGMGYVLRAP
ncbi:MAG: response regulator transcription factor [Actinomycetota bacterium]|nr:response regulator transcription factor [Actinomycetota bacterium]HSH22816.1 response regulator transcription factor [Acidimicrobiales bacterium]